MFEIKPDPKNGFFTSSLPTQLEGLITPEAYQTFADQTNGLYEKFLHREKVGRHILFFCFVAFILQLTGFLVPIILFTKESYHFVFIVLTVSISLILGCVSTVVYVSIGESNERLFRKWQDLAGSIPRVESSVRLEGDSFIRWFIRYWKINVIIMRNEHYAVDFIK